MKRKFNRFLSVLLALLTLSGLLAVGVSADHGILEEERPCSLNLVLTRPAGEGSTETIPLEGGRISLYRIARIRTDSRGNQTLSMHHPFYKDRRLSWTNIEKEEDLLKKLPVRYLLEDIEKWDVDATAVSELSDKDGKISFTNLKSGLYLVKLKNAEAVDCAMQEFLLTLPVEVDGVYDYDCKLQDVKPKTVITDALVDIKVIKVWKGDVEKAPAEKKDDKDKDKHKPVVRPQSITIQLLNGSQISDEIVISKKDNWSCVFKNKPAGGDWKVQEKKLDHYQADVGRMKWVDDHYEVTIINTAEGSLVQTGELNWPVPYLVIAGVLLMLGGYMVCHEKKKY